MDKLRFFYLLLVCFLFLGPIGCQKALLVSEQEMSAFSDTTLYYSTSSVPRIYYTNGDAHPGIFVTELDPKTPQVVPRAVYDSTDYGARKDPSRPQNMRLLLRVYNSKANPLTKESYFETPILYSDFKVSNVTTAISWVLRWSFMASGELMVSYNLFDQLVKSVEVVCADCRSKTSSQVVDLILSSESLKNKIIQTLSIENPGLVISSVNYSPPDYIYAYSSPNAIENGGTLKDSSEASEVSFSAYLINPKNSNFLVKPLKWTHEFNLVTTDKFPTDGILIHTFDYSEAGTHAIKPFFDNIGTNLGLVFNVEVEDANRIPICDEPLEIFVRENVRIQSDLKTKCRDLDIDEMNLAFSLVGGPSGLTISTLGILEWTGKKQGSVNRFNVDFVINDSKLGSKSARMTLIVGDDRMPAFENLPSSMAMTEGIGSLQTFRASDPDGDPIIVKIKPLSTISTASPVGAGVLTEIIRTVVGGSYEFEWVFTPSWMQGIGTNATFQLEFQLYYDPLEDSLNPAVLLASQIVDVNLTNTDDPPIWLESPQDFGATEGTAIVGHRVGKAMDAPVSPSALTFALRNLSGPTCSWLEEAGGLVVDGDGYVTLNVTPAYNSEETCRFLLIATDSVALATESVEAIVTVADTNRPISTRADAPLVFELKEGVSWNQKMQEIFTDADFEEVDYNDPREGINGTCMWDHDADGVYDHNCSMGVTPIPATDPRITVAGQSLAYYSTPLPGLGGKSYNIEFTVTDKGGVTASHRATLNIAESPTAMVAEPTPDGVTSATQITALEGQDTILYLKLTAASARPIDQYDYKISSPICVKSTGGPCRAGFFANPMQMEGNGDGLFPFTIRPDYTEGDASFPLDEFRYFMVFRIEKTDDSSLGTDLTVPILVKNVNRNPTSISITAKTNEGCFGSSVPDLGSGDHTFCVDASKDSKNGSVWAKTYTATFGSVDPDLTNDSYSYASTSTKMPGVVSDNKWTFKLPSCILSGYSTVTRTFPFEVSDGRGGTVVRNINLKIQKANTAGSCM